MDDETQSPEPLSADEQGALLRERVANLSFMAGAACLAGAAAFLFSAPMGDWPSLAAAGFGAAVCSSLFLLSSLLRPERPKAEPRHAPAPSGLLPDFGLRPENPQHGETQSPAPLSADEHGALLRERVANLSFMAGAACSAGSAAFLFSAPMGDWPSLAAAGFGAAVCSSLFLLSSLLRPERRG